MRVYLGDLRDLPNDHICDALRFVHSEQLTSHFFFDRPPPQIELNKFCDWHYVQAAKVLTLRHVYAIATNMNLEECCEALRNCNWSLMATLEAILN